jgi:predicted O-methyltransferase YrrM
MLVRVNDFFSFLGVDDEERKRGERGASFVDLDNMTAQRDREALAAIALRFKPRQIFEIGTFRGTTSEFLMSMLPECRIVSIAMSQGLFARLFRTRFNNSHLSREQIGCNVRVEHRTRYTQLYGDSHKLDVRSILKRFGPFDMVFIDGDHRRLGVAQDTELAKSIITESGVICWHDANPKSSYLDVRRFLEQELDLTAMATTDDYVGGIACWSHAVTDILAKTA